MSEWWRKWRHGILAIVCWYMAIVCFSEFQNTPGPLAAVFLILSIALIIAAVANMIMQQLFPLVIAFLLIPSSSHALEIGRDTIEQVIDRIAISDCEWSEVIQQVTTVHYRDFVPLVVNDKWGGHTPQPRPGIFPNPCFINDGVMPEWCAPKEAHWEGWWFGSGQWREWDERIVLTFNRLANECHDCTVVPESGTWAMVGLGIVGLVVVQGRKQMCTVVVPKRMKERMQ